MQLKLCQGDCKWRLWLLCFWKWKSCWLLEFLVMLAWLEVELRLLVYIVWMVTMGSSSKASLNGVSSAIPNVSDSYTLLLFIRHWEFLSFLTKWNGAEKGKQLIFLSFMRLSYHSYCYIKMSACLIRVPVISCFPCCVDAFLLFPNMFSSLVFLNRKRSLVFVFLLMVARGWHTKYPLCTG